MLYVGGVFGRTESFTIGEALMLALASEGHAGGGGEIIVCDAAFSLVSEYFKARHAENKETGEVFPDFWLVDFKTTGQRVKI